MTLAQLVERLEEYRDMLGDDVEVRLMTQRNWPFEYSVFGVTSGEEIREESEGEEHADVEDDDVVFIVEGNQLGYGSMKAWEIDS